MHVPAELGHDTTLPSCFSACAVNKLLFWGLFSATFTHVFCLLVVILLFKVVPERGAKVLSSVLSIRRL